MMSDNKLQNRSSQPGLRQAGWLLSFSDLLTLVLCFFLILVAGPVDQSTAMNDQASSPESAPASQLEAQHNRTGPAPTAQTGTELANQNRKAQQFNVWIHDSDFSSDGLTLSSESLQKMKEHVLLEGYKLAGLRLAVCSEANSQSESQAWFSSAGRILAIRGQLLDTGLYAGRAELRLLGPNCQRLLEHIVESSSSQEKQVGLVSFRFEKAEGKKVFDSQERL